MKPNDFAASIVADARKQAAEVDKRTKAELKEIKAETQRLVSERRARLIAEVQREEEQERNRVEAKRHLESTIATLTVKQRLIDEAFADAAEQLTTLPAKEREGILARLWEHAGTQLDIARVEAAAQDAAFFRGKADVTPIECIGGFVAHSADGLVSIDCRFETILDGVRQRDLKRISDTLLGGKA